MVRVKVVHACFGTVIADGGFDSLNQCLVVPQTSMNATQQMEDVNTVALTPLGASSVGVTQGISWMEMD